MGRRKRRRTRPVAVVKRKLPTVFQCPRCGAQAVSVTVKKTKEEKYVLVRCSNCSLSMRYDYKEYLEPVDYFSRFLDDYGEGKISSQEENIGEENGESEELHNGEN
jgi:transcription elongation factor Elf1